ncbi:TIR domain-containing protein [Seongchinamella sediminis]|uniref:TIR domain-containing protein n=1 Tax=Seongchinamella sediminis TaxID=2283635 RepID=A0A3L7DYC0_9GAMM|nr:toll/interleukin-1 receptor domain-containing protein [Seongchinamella sediminis]RLQ22244.1 TIR domain-containing protein [Seongchinamella sediminis]
MPAFKYKAFISYSHEDEAIARWLHRALESYRPPRGAQAPAAASPHSSNYPLRPIFRDQEELVAAANLSNSLVEALRQSEYLIVICSPSAARSHWTGQEIIEFKKIHGADNIIAVIAEGDPGQSFPAPLRQQVLPSGEIGAAVLEPLAADIQGGRSSRRLALHKVAATLLGVDLDRLVQREAQRRYRFLALVAAATTVGMVAMGWLTYTAVDQRRAADAARLLADQSRLLAEQRREDAEGLIEFMLGDLRQKLQPVGRLDVLDSVGAKALEYYAGQEQQTLSADSLGRRARALHLLGEISDMKGDTEAAEDRFSLAAESTRLLMEANPQDPRHIFNHAQSVFWVGMVDYQQGRFAEARVSFEQYLHYAEQLLGMAPDEPEWLLEVFYGHQALGGLAVEVQNWAAAETSLVSAVDTLRELRRQGEPHLLEWAGIHSWLFSVYLHQKHFDRARQHNQEEVKAFGQILAADPSDYTARLQLVIARRGGAQLAMIGGDPGAALTLLEPLARELEALAAFEPDQTQTVEQAVLLLQDLAEVRLARGELALAAELAQNCLQQAQNLVQRDDSILVWQVELDWKCRYLAARTAYLQGEVEVAQRLLDSYYPQLAADYAQLSAQKEAPLLLGQSSLLRGDIVYTQGRESDARELWSRADAVLSGDVEALEPRRIATLAAVASRLGLRQRAAALAAYLRKVEYRYPGLESGAD